MEKLDAHVCFSLFLFQVLEHPIRLHNKCSDNDFKGQESSFRKVARLSGHPILIVCFRHILVATDPEESCEVVLASMSHSGSHRTQIFPGIHPRMVWQG